MLSAIVLVADAAAPHGASPEAIVRTLGALVPSVIEGLVRDLTLASCADDTLLRDIADHAGCEVAIASSPGGTLAAGLAAARGDWILAIRAGYAPQPGFSEELADLLHGAERRPDLARLRAEPGSLITRLAPSFAIVAGVVGARASFAKGGRDLAILSRRAPTLRSRLRRVG